jgi:hypothetical protein
MNIIPKTRLTIFTRGQRSPKPRVIKRGVKRNKTWFQHLPEPKYNSPMETYGANFSRSLSATHEMPRPISSLSLGWFRWGPLRGLRGVMSVLTCFEPRHIHLFPFIGIDDIRLFIAPQLPWPIFVSSSKKINTIFWCPIYLHKCRQASPGKMMTCQQPTSLKSRALEERLRLQAPKRYLDHR